MVKKVDQDIVDRRLEETLDLFQPTAQQEAAAAQQEATERKAAPKSRGWDRRPENRPFSYRSGEELNNLINAAVAEYKAKGWHTTRGKVLKAWALAGRELWLQGQVEVDGRPIGGSGTRRRKE